jgi:hypothetical protein
MTATLHTFTVRTVQLTTGGLIGSTDPTPPDDANSLVLQGDFLLNGNLRVPGEGKINLTPPFGPPIFEEPPPKIEIALGQADLFPLMLADWAPGGIVINFETGGDLTINPTPPFPGPTELTRYWITFLRALA